MWGQSEGQGHIWVRVGAGGTWARARVGVRGPVEGRVWDGGWGHAGARVGDGEHFGARMGAGGAQGDSGGRGWGTLGARVGGGAC